MRKLLILLGAVLVSTQAFATYFVVLKDGTQIRAMKKWTLVNGKAVVTLEGGGTMALDPNSIDVAKSEETTKMGGASVLAVEQTQTTAQPQGSTLGGAFKLRKLPTDAQQNTAPGTNTAPIPMMNATTRAISLAEPKRPAGVLAANACCASTDGQIPR